MCGVDATVLVWRPEDSSEELLFSSTLMQVLKNLLRLPGLHSKRLYPANHLSGSFRLFPKKLTRVSLFPSFFNRVQNKDAAKDCVGAGVRVCGCARLILGGQGGRSSFSVNRLERPESK